MTLEQVMLTERQGKCVRCAVRWMWHVNRHGNPKLRDAFCPECGDPLARTSYHWTGGKLRYIGRPATVTDAAILRLVRQLLEAEQLVIPGTE